MAVLLNFVLKSLVSSENMETKIKEPKEVEFYPENQIEDLVCIYSNLVNNETFVTYVVKDERSFNIDYMRKA